MENEKLLKGVDKLYNNEEDEEHRYTMGKYLIIEAWAKYRPSSE